MRDRRKSFAGIEQSKMNAYLKETADVGIQKQFTFHYARHKFAITVTLTNGVPMKACRNAGSKKPQNPVAPCEILDFKSQQNMELLRERLSLSGMKQTVRP